MPPWGVNATLFVGMSGNAPAPEPSSACHVAPPSVVSNTWLSPAPGPSEKRREKPLATITMWFELDGSTATPLIYRCGTPDASRLASMRVHVQEPDVESYVPTAAPRVNPLTL